MDVGVPKEIKQGENRVGMTPDGVAELVRKGNVVYVQKAAGSGAGFADEEYSKAGAKMVETPEEVFAKSRLIVKVKEPIGKELKMLNSQHILFTYLHLAAEKPITEQLMACGCTAIAYETIQDHTGKLPLLAPMSEVAGRMAALVAAEFLNRNKGGRGVLVSGVPGTPPARFLVFGAGFAGENAALMAYGMGAEVVIIEKNIDRLRQVSRIMPKAKGLVSNAATVERELREADAVISGVLIPGYKAPKLISREALKTMKEGSVFVDIAIDQGGSAETSRATSHAQPTYVESGVIHYCVPNMPAAYPRTSTIALTNATLPYAVQLAEKGVAALSQDKGFLKGLNVHKGKVTNEGVAEAFGMEFVPPAKALGLQG